MIASIGDCMRCCSIVTGSGVYVLVDPGPHNFAGVIRESLKTSPTDSKQCKTLSKA